MPTYKDSKTGKWFCKFYYTDHTGERKQKKKRGFDLQRDAKKWESDFLAKMEGAPDMTFAALAALYLEDRKVNVKPSSYESMENRIRNRLIPALGDRPINEITSNDIRKWQNDLKTQLTDFGKPLSDSYLKNIVNQASTVFNFGVRYYGLRENPIRTTGCIVGKKEKSINFWTKDQFDKFIATFDRQDPFYTIFMVLYYTGIRKGELQALTPADMDLVQGRIDVNKTLRVIDGETVIMPPKTPKSRRTVLIPGFLCDILRDYIGRIYAPGPDERIFCYGRSAFGPQLDKHARLAGIPRIRVHDLRHSHASLLIELGFSALLVAERLGHENVSTTLDIYSHLFPSKQSQVADRLQKLHENKS